MEKIPQLQQLTYLPPLSSDRHFFGLSRFDRDVNEDDWNRDVSKISNHIFPTLRLKNWELDGPSGCSCCPGVDGMRFARDATEIGFAILPIQKEDDDTYLSSRRARIKVLNQLAFDEMSKIAGDCKNNVYLRLIKEGILLETEPLSLKDRCKLVAMDLSAPAISTLPKPLQRELAQLEKC